MQTKNNFSAMLLYLSVAVLLHVYVVLKFDTIIIDKLHSATDVNSLAVFYSVIIAILGLGHITFSMSKTFFLSENSKIEYLKPVALSVMAVCLFTAMLMYSSTLSLIAFSAIYTAYFLGYLGGWVLWSISVFLNGAHYTGRIIGTVILAATLALKYSSSFIKSEIIQLLVIASFTIAFVTMIHDLWRNKFSIPQNLPNKEDSDTSIIKKGFLYITVVALMTVLAGISNSLFLKIYSTDKTYTMQFYHVIHGFSAFLFGFLFDLRKRVYFQCVSAVLFIVLTFSPFLLNLTGYGPIYGVIACSYVGLFCILYLLPFINIAQHTRSPELWASCGAITRYLVSGLVIIPITLLVEFFSIEMIIVINIIITVLLVKILSFNHNEADIVVKESAKDENNMNSRIEKCPTDSSDKDVFRPNTEIDYAIDYDGNQLTQITKFAEKHALTSTETKALLHIISSEEPLKVISGKENISERTFQRYLTKIYEKTGTKTRAGLVSAFHKSISNGHTGSNNGNSAD